MAKKKPLKWQTEFASTMSGRVVRRAKKLNEVFEVLEEAKVLASPRAWSDLGRSPFLVWGELRSNKGGARAYVNYLGSRGPGYTITYWGCSICPIRSRRRIVDELLHANTCAHALALQFLLVESPKSIRESVAPLWLAQDVAKGPLRAEEAEWLEAWEDATQQAVTKKKAKTKKKATKKKATKKKVKTKKKATKKKATKKKAKTKKKANRA